MTGSTAWDVVFVAVTGFIAWHGITYRDEEGESDIVRLLFGCIAALFCVACCSSISSRCSASRYWS